MSEAYSDDNDEENGYKSHYFIDLKARKPEASAGRMTDCPFIPLAQESETTCKDRFRSYVAVWKEQELAIHKILATVNDSLFKALAAFATSLVPTLDNSLPVAFLQMGSNVANNSRVLLDLTSYLHSFPVLSSQYVLVTLDGKACNTARLAVRSIVKQVCLASNIVPNSRSNHDLHIISKLPQTRLLVLLRDANGVLSLVLNQLVRLLHALSEKHDAGVRCIFGLPAQSVLSWLKHRLSRSMRSVVNASPFSATGSVNQDIVNRLFLNASLPLMLDPNLASLLSNRFSNASSSVDSLISQVKFCYLTHYYQLPLPMLLHRPPQELLSDPGSAFYVTALRRLASFKLHLETQLAHAEEGYQLRIALLLESSAAVIDLFCRARTTFLEYHQQILATIQLVEAIQHGFPERLETLHLYTLLVSSTFLSSPQVSSLFMQLRHADPSSRMSAAHRAAQVDGKLGKQLLEICSGDIDLQPASFVTAIKAHVSGLSLLAKPITNLVFYEVFTLNGDSRKSMVAPPLLQENISNLMLKTLRPPLRPLLECALDDISAYRGTLEEKEHLPTIVHMFRLLKDAPQSINIYDFYVAFRESLDRDGLMPLLADDGDEAEKWERATYAWFLQNCHELMNMGFLREKAKGDVLEKAIWKGV